MRIDSQGKIWKHDYFKNVQVNEYFRMNGSLWRKRSTRTAVLVRPEEYSGRWFYFCKMDLLERQWTPAIA